MNYTSKQIKAHGEEIIAFENGLKIEAYHSFDKEWYHSPTPFFYTSQKYRIAKENPYYENELGEKFYKKDKAYFFVYDDNSVVSIKISELKNFKETSFCSEAFKTKLGALQSEIKRIIK